MITQEVVESIMELTGLDRVKSKRIYAMVIRSLIKHLKEDGELKLPKVGKFIVRQKQEYLGVNPRTLERIRVKPRKTIFFQTSTVLKRLLEE